MKNYKVTLLDVNGNSVLSHNLLAFNDADANTKAKLCVANARNKEVVNYKLQ